MESDKAANEQQMRIRVLVNSKEYVRSVPVRKTLADFLREDLGLTGTHLGCEHGVCGACTVMLGDSAVRSCLLLAVQADGASVTSIEGISGANPRSMHPVQHAFWDHHGLQCGFCTPGMVISAIEFLRDNPRPTRQDIRRGMSGNLCRCTGYQFIVDAIEAAAIGGMEVRAQSGGDE